uniref:Uncharacterized protein n=1 Tax=Ananas comosus var. bracteatus TaxID=296719 RepID=A0A6V7PWP4_ANACO|nr:unnamed protein product [Ananas comosus var. bracteatus]
MERRFSIVASLVAAAVVVAVSLNGAEGWSTYDAKAFHVVGKVLCQDCSKGWNQWAHGATPIVGSKVGVTCMGPQARVLLHKSDACDRRGEFDIVVDKYVNGVEVNPEECTVRLVSSGCQNCTVMTNFNGGKDGVRLSRPSTVYPGHIAYKVGPFYFTIPKCDLPRK